MTDDLSAERRAAFIELHKAGCFLIPNPWDAGSARYLQRLGFRALATTSAGFAFSQGLPDAGVTLDAAIGHAADIVAATSLPVSCDFQAGYASDPEEVVRNVTRCAATGVAGLSIEDSTGDPAHPLFDREHAIERIRAARLALAGTGVMLTARAECFLTGHPDPLRESIRRLQAYAEAGADVLYAPGPRRREEFEAIVKALSPKPVNVLIGWHTELTLGDLASFGVRRVSVGSGLARAAWAGFMRAAGAMAKDGSFAGLDGLPAFAEIDTIFR